MTRTPFSLLGLREEETDSLRFQEGSVTKLGFLPGTTTPAEEISYDGLAIARRELIRTSTLVAREYNYLYGPGNHRFVRLERQALPSVGLWEREHTVRDLNGKILRTWQGEGFGTPRLITEGQNEVGGYHNYYPYGDEIQHPSTTRDDRICKFTGHERDPHGRTDYMLARTYGYQI